MPPSFLRLCLRGGYFPTPVSLQVLFLLFCFVGFSLCVIRITLRATVFSLRAYTPLFAFRVSYLPVLIRYRGPNNMQPLPGKDFSLAVLRHCVSVLVPFPSRTLAWHYFSTPFRIVQFLFYFCFQTSHTDTHLDGHNLLPVAQGYRIAVALFLSPDFDHLRFASLVTRDFFFLSH